MQQVLLSDTLHILRFDKGEDLLNELSAYCEKKQIQAGTFTGLGAAAEVILSYYKLPLKKYEDKAFTNDLEITSLIGNIAYLDEKIIIHAHGVFGNSNYEAVTGHVKKIIISATGEIHITVSKGTMHRKFDDETGLNLLYTEH